MWVQIQKRLSAYGLIDRGKGYITYLVLNSIFEEAATGSNTVRK